MEGQLRRQATWLKDSLLWILRTKIIEPGSYRSKPSAIDVGCGPGFTMELFSPFADVKGVDIDPEMVKESRLKGFDVTEGTAENLSYEDGTFDIAYCSFLLMWVKDPLRVIQEMNRVSRRWVVAFAEPDYGARLDYPSELSVISKLVTEGIRREGGEPLIGRKLRHLFGQVGIDAELGVHMGIWSLEKLKAESEGEWKWIEMTAEKRNIREIGGLRTIWEHALESGALFQFNPTFYAVGDKQRLER